MDTIALKGKASEIYSIFDFINMTELEREKFKGKIVCVECGGDAYYRGTSSDGRIPCFCAKHIGDCSKKSSNTNNSEQGEEEVNKINLDTSEFDISWNYKSSKQENGIKGDRGEEGDRGKRNTKIYVADPPIKKRAKIRLNQILEFAEYGILDSQDYNIRINDTRIKLPDIVMRLEDINDEILNKKMFFWGSVSSINSCYINTRYDNKVSIIIGEKAISKFESLYKKRLIKIINDNVVIVFGKLIKAKSNRYFIIIDEAKQIYFRKPRK